MHVLRRLLALRARSRRPPSARIGRRGERKAVRALARAGYRILGRNVRTPAAEIDVLALEGDVLVLVEVKTTTSDDARWPVTARLGSAQVQRLRRAGVWLARRPALQGRLLRGDLVTVECRGRRSRVTIHRGWF